MSEYFIWFLVSVLFFVIELLLPTFIVFFFGLSSLVLSIITYFYNLSINTQLILFIIICLLSILLLRNYIKNIFTGDQKLDIDNYTDKNKNISAISMDDIPSGRTGQIKFNGTFYNAKAVTKVYKNQQVKIIKQNEQENLFLVKPEEE